MLYLEILYPKQQTFPGLPAGVLRPVMLRESLAGGITFIRIAD